MTFKLGKHSKEIWNPKEPENKKVAENINVNIGHKFYLQGSDTSHVTILSDNPHNIPINSYFKAAKICIKFAY